MSLCILLLFVTNHLHAAPVTSLQASTEVASEGYLGFSWQPPAAVKLEQKFYLQVAGDRQFNRIIASYPLLGQSRASVSGLNDGNYFSRLVNAQKQPLSNVAQFTVKHRNLHTAWMLFSLGAFLFALLVAAVIRLSRQQNQ